MVNIVLLADCKVSKIFERRVTQKGYAMKSLGIASTKTLPDGRKFDEYFTLTFWGNVVDTVDTMQEGDNVVVEGYLTNRKMDDGSYKLEINGRSITKLDSSDNQQQQEQKQSSQQMKLNSDDIPF